MAHYAENFAALLEEGLKKATLHDYEEWPKLYPQIAVVEKTRKAQEKYEVLDGFGTYPETDPGDEGAETEIRILGEAQINVKTFSQTVYHGYNLFEDDLYGVLKKAARRARLAKIRMYQTKDTYVANILNNGFDSNYTVAYDGKEFFATDHSSNAGDQANEPAVASALSYDTLGDLILIARSLTDDEGLPIMAMPRELVIPNALEDTAYEILDERWQPGSANYNSNWIKNHYSKVSPVVNPFLTSDTAFFLKLTDPGKDGIQVNERRGLTEETVKEPKRLRFAVTYYWRAGFGVVNWRTWVASPGA